MVVVISIPSARLWKHYGSKVQFSRRRKDSGSKTERWEKEGVTEEKGGGAAAMLLLSLFLWKRPCSVCVLHCVVLPLAKATKASIYLS